MPLTYHTSSLLPFLNFSKEVIISPFSISTLTLFNTFQPSFCPSPHNRPCSHQDYIAKDTEYLTVFFFLLDHSAAFDATDLFKTHCTLNSETSYFSVHSESSLRNYVRLKCCSSSKCFQRRLRFSLNVSFLSSSTFSSFDYKLHNSKILSLNQCI